MKKILIDTRKLSDVLLGVVGTNTPVGKAVDFHDNWYVAFVSTDAESGKIRYSQDGMLICNVRKQRERTETRDLSDGHLLALADVGE